MRLIELDNVDTYYGQIHILHGLSLHVDAGELVCLLGGNASGKSTTLKTILGLVRPRSGQVRIEGAVEKVSTSPAQRFPMPAGFEASVESLVGSYPSAAMSGSKTLPLLPGKRSTAARYAAKLTASFLFARVRFQGGTRRAPPRRVPTAMRS